MNKDKQLGYEVVLPGKVESAVLLQLNALTRQYAEQGLMLELTLEHLTKLVASGMLALALGEEGEVLGTASITHSWVHEGTGEIWHEFGGWAVLEEAKKHGVGKNLFAELMSQLNFKPSDHVFALGNETSSPILQKLGGTLMAQDLLPLEVFDPCQDCHCPAHRKALLHAQKKCVDDAIDLTHLMKKELV